MVRSFLHSTSNHCCSRLFKIAWLPFTNVTKSVFNLSKCRVDHWGSLAQKIFLCSSRIPQRRTTRDRQSHWPCSSITGKSFISNLGVYWYLIISASIWCHSHMCLAGSKKWPSASLQYRATFDPETYQSLQDGVGNPWIHNM